MADAKEEIRHLLKYGKDVWDVDDMYELCNREMRREIDKLEEKGYNRAAALVRLGVVNPIKQEENADQTPTPRDV